MEDLPIGLESWGIYIPEYRHTSQYIAKQTGIPKDIIERKFGLKSKSVPGSEDHTVAMGAKASYQALKRANITANDIDVIIWAGEVYAERPLMTYGIKLQQLLGNPSRPWAFDINQRCGTFLIGILLAKSLILTKFYLWREGERGYRVYGLLRKGKQKTIESFMKFLDKLRRDEKLLAEFRDFSFNPL